MELKQADAEKSATIPAYPGLRGNVRLWIKGSKILLETYNAWGVLVASLTISKPDLQKALKELDI